MTVTSIRGDTDRSRSSCRSSRCPGNVTRTRTGACGSVAVGSVAVGSVAGGSSLTAPSSIGEQHLLDEEAPLHLAGRRRAGDLVQHDESTGVLEGSQAVGAVGAHLVDGGRIGAGRGD